MGIAKGTATIGTIAVGDKNVKLVLAISKKDFFRNAKFFEGAPEEVEFILGDMQMNLSDYFDEDAEAEREDERRRNWLLAQRTRVTGTVDSNGVVVAVEQGEGQAELVEQEPGSSPEQKEDGAEPGDQEIGEKLDEIVQETAETDTDAVESDQETGQTGEHPDGSDDAELIEAIENGDFKGESAPSDKKIELEDIENYIMENAPKFDNIEYDFAAILLRKKETNETWREIANSMGISSGVITAAYSEVKKRVKKILEEQTGAA